MPQFSGRHGRDEAIDCPINSSSGASFAEGVTTAKTLTAGTIVISGAPTAGSGAGSAWGTANIPVFGTNQAYLPISLGGTTYRIPIWKNA
jgi:hypothetical protein